MGVTVSLREDLIEVHVTDGSRTRVYVLEESGRLLLVFEADLV